MLLIHQLTFDIEDRFSQLSRVAHALDRYYANPGTYATFKPGRRWRMRRILFRRDIIEAQLFRFIALKFMFQTQHMQVVQSEMNDVDVFQDLDTSFAMDGNHLLYEDEQ